MASSKKIADKLLFIAASFFIIFTIILLFRDAWNNEIITRIIQAFQAISATAIIGGIADWYGVVSIYGKPLGFPWRTQIIINKREELTKEIINFVCNDVLSKDNIKEKLSYDGIIKHVLELFPEEEENEGPRVWLNNCVSAIVWQVIKIIEFESIGNYVDKLLFKILTRIDFSKEIIRISIDLMSKGYDDEIINKIASELSLVFKNAEVRSILREYTDRAVNAYVSDAFFRKLISGLLRDRTFDSAIEKINEYFKELINNPEHPDRLQLKHWVKKSINNFENNKEGRVLLDNWIYSNVESGTISELINSEIKKQRDTGVLSESGCKELCKKFLDWLIEYAHTNERIQELDQWLIEMIINQVDKNHDMIGKFMLESLNKISNHELVGYIQGNTENDMQGIRINGMVTGLIVGAFFIILKFIFK